MVDIMDKSNLASMLRDYENRMNPTTNKSTLSQAIGENALGNVSKDPVEAAKTVGDIVSKGITALDLANVINLNPVLAAGKGIYDISRMSEEYDQQKIDDLAKYGRGTTGLGTFARSLPYVGGIASLFSGPTTRPDLDPLFRRYLASRDIDIDDWQGPPVVGPPPIAPVERGTIAAPPGAKAAPWVNPNLPPTQHSFDNWGYTEDTGTTSTGETYDWGDFYAKGGIASLIA